MEVWLPHGLSAFISGLSCLGLSACRGHCVEFLGKTSLSASLHPGVFIKLIVTGKFNAGGNLEMVQLPILQAGWGGGGGE